MNKAGIVQSVRSSMDCSAASAERSVNAVLAAIKSGLQTEGVVQVVGFGTFAVKERSARQIRSPKTRELVQVPASKTVAFKAGQPLRDSLIDGDGRGRAAGR